jgi:DNA-binding CsgD family transcriptional regulator
MRSVNATKRVRAICDLLDTIRLGAADDTWSEVSRELRALLDSEQVWTFQVRQVVTNWRMTRWSSAGAPTGFGDAFANALASAPLEWAWFKPSCPDPAQRNRVVEALSASSKRRPGYFEASHVFAKAFYPHRLHRHRQLRVLVCDENRLLGWCGAVQPTEGTRRQHAILGAIVPSLRRRMVAERRLATIPHLDRALDVALDHLDVPAWILERERVVYANRGAIAAMTSGAGVTGDRIPIGREVIMVIGRARSDRGDKVAASAERWKLTHRTTDVLRHVVDGHANATIAQMLGISTRAVELHITRLFDRAGVEGRAALVGRVLGN